MKRAFHLIIFILVILSMTGCTLKAPSYEGATTIKMLDEDKESYIKSGILDYSFTLFNHSIDIMWTKDEAADAQKRLDKSLPKDKWRLESDWTGPSSSMHSEWRNGDIGLVVLVFGNLDGTQINNLERRYGMSGMEPGATLIVMYTYDKNKPLPDRTATAVFKSQSATQTAKPTALKVTPTPKP